MRLREQRLFDRCKANLPREIRLERIENVVGSGTPDLHAIYRGRTTWIELKAIEDIPARMDTQLLDSNHRPSIEQRNWHLDYTQHGGRSLVVIGIGPRAIIAIEAAWIDELSSGMPLHEALHLAVALDWDELAAYLKGNER
jgi:hypothetical protein